MSEMPLPPCKGGGIPAPLQGAPIDSETQGVALGYHAAAPSAPEPKLCKSEFTSLDGWPFMRWLLVTNHQSQNLPPVTNHQSPVTRHYGRSFAVRAVPLVDVTFLIRKNRARTPVT